MPPRIRIFYRVALRDTKGERFSQPVFQPTNHAQRFLELMAAEPNKFFVPTLDIDLAWQYASLPYLDLRREG